MPDRQRRPTPWEAAQIFPPPRSWLRRALLVSRIRWAATSMRPANRARHASPNHAPHNERPYGASNG